MPNITVEIFSGRTLDQRREFVRGVTDAAVNAFGISPEGVRITFFEIEKHDLARGGELLGDRATSAQRTSTSNGATS